MFTKNGRKRRRKHAFFSACAGDAAQMVCSVSEDRNTCEDAHGDEEKVMIFVKSDTGFNKVFGC